MFRSKEVGLHPVRTGRTLAVRLAEAAVLMVVFLLSRPAFAQMTLTGSVSPRQVSYVGTLTYTASASGGDAGTTQYAFFRRRPGGTWIPDINAPTWQSSNVYGWHPTLSDVGTWETYIWVKDGNTPSNANTYGYAAGYNTMPIEVFGPPSTPGPTTVACAYSVSDECWVTGDFVASASASTGGLGSISYQICRSNDTTGWGGCDVNLTLSGGTSYTVSGSHLPADGYRRAYYFRAGDSAGAWSGFNSPIFVKVDRYAPAVSASNASVSWYSYRTATVSASDSGSGVQSVRYNWGSPLDGNCSTGTATSSGATLVAPNGDNTLYLCARDRTGRVAQWSGQYRVAPLSLSGSITPSQASYLGTFTYTANASGGDPSTLRYAFFRRRPGGVWTPDVNNPTWSASNTFTWAPSQSDVGTWETYIWVKDGSTTPTQNTYGYAAGFNTMPVEVVGPPTAPGATAVSCAYWAASTADCWVTGDFTISAAASTGGMGSLVYQICRSVDSAGGWAGCDVNLTLTGGTSIVVSTTHLPSDGYRRAYYFQAKDSAGALSGWNLPQFVRVDRYPPTVSATNASGLWFSSRTATLAAGDATGGAGSNSGLQGVRYSWNTALDANCTTGTATSSGTTLTAPAGDNVLYLCARDNAGRVGQWSGQYRIAPMSLGGSVSPSRASYLGSFTWTMAASGGTPATTQYAFFRRRPGGTWTPDVNSPIWQAGNTYTWRPGQSDVGTWETYVWVKDGDTPSNANTYGYAAGLNTLPIEVVGPPTAPGATATGCAYWVASTADCWVAGNFTVSAAAATGGMGSLVYQICRSNDTTGWGGCDVNLTLAGGTSIAVSGADLPTDGYRRAYYFRAGDSAGAWSGFNVPVYVRVDRNAPAVSASNASDSWFPSRTATVTASDAAGGAGANSGVLEVRYSWNAALDANCTTGTVTSSGATLTAPVGDNLLYLCARDNVQRVTQWNGRYRVTAPMTLIVAPPPARSSYLSTFTFTATATGGDPNTRQFAVVRRRPGGAWIPDPGAAVWQSSNILSWKPALEDVGNWEFYFGVKDAFTPPDMNGYGYAAGYYLAGPFEVVGPPAAPGATTVACAYSVASTADCWVAGNFTISAAAATGGLGSLVYQICRSNDTTGWGGCDVNFTLSGGTSLAVSGTDLPPDGYRRAYYFRAGDSAGAWSGFNVPAYVRVDRNAPAVSASNASDDWFTSRTATVAASDTTGGAVANSGLLEVRYSWNAALDANCTTGTVTSPGATLTVPAGDNLLYLCARDRVGRVAAWNGRYRVQSVPAPAVTSVTPNLIHQGGATILTVLGSNLQGASVYVATEPIDETTPAPEPLSAGGGEEIPVDSRPFPWAELLSVNAAGTVLTVRINAQDPGIEGFYNLAVETPGGKTAGQFRVVGAAPTIDVYTPSQPVQGNVHLFMFAGANLQGANVVPADPAVKVLDLDNSRDDAIMGLLYVDSDTPAGTYDIRVERPTGESMTLSVQVVASTSSTSLMTSKISIPGRTEGPDVPDVLLQQPVSNLLVHADGIRSSFATPPPAPTGFSICLWTGAGQKFQVSAVLLSLLDVFDKPLTRQVLNRLHPGDRLNFKSLTIGASASLEYEFRFQVCNGWVTDLFVCVHGKVSYMVPLVGGYTLAFDYCRGTEGPRLNLSAQGSITHHEWSTSNACVQVEDSDPTSESGERAGVIDVNCCTPADISLHTTGSAFQSFDVQGPVASVQPENCQQPAPAALRVFLDVDRDNVVVDGEGKPDLNHLYLPAELDDSATYLPCSPVGANGAPPGASLLPNQLPQRMTVYAAYVQNLNGKLKIVPPPSNVTSVEIALQGTSTLSGIATNYPSDPAGGTGSNSQDPDFWLTAVGDNAAGGQTVTVNFGSPGAPSVLAAADFYCNDYGGSTRLTARVPEGASAPPLAVPTVAFGSGSRGLPSLGWNDLNNQRVQTGSLQDTSDDDSTPTGAGVGDGLSAFSEYRGMVINGTHYRLNPTKKDVFVEWDPGFSSLAGMPQLGLEIHRPRTNDLYSVPNGPGSTILYTNIHSVGMSLDNPVVAIHLVDDPAPVPSGTSYQLGVTSGTVAAQEPVVSTVYSARIQHDAGNHLPQQGLYDWVLSHELGHAVNICHREEDQQGQPVGTCTTSSTIDPQAVIPNGVFYMHSGTIFGRIKNSSNPLAGPARSYHPNSAAQVKLK